ncbi:DUF1016 family protein [bacterium]|nr:DUF1016 family protein [bacterium]
MTGLTKTPEYEKWLAELKNRLLKVQLKAVVAVNTELLMFYWQLGAEVVHKQQESQWGDGLTNQLSHDLIVEFPEMKGFSVSNINYIRQWYLFYRAHIVIDQQLVGQLPNSDKTTLIQKITAIPWGHNIAIIAKCKTITEALFYVENTQNHNWSRAILTHQMETGLWQREGKAITNFKTTLPAPQSDLAQQTLKDPYVFDFLTLTKEHNERDLELGLVKHITNFLLELGADYQF